MIGVYCVRCRRNVYYACRYHLQAFRHLYVLAAEKRIVIPRDIDSRQACFVELELVFKVSAALQSVISAFSGS